jgi:16S rRNA (uracil1498-N3)-methyltransferase
MGKPDGDQKGIAMKAPPWLLVAPGTLEPAATLVLDPTEARHLTSSLRRRPGDEIVLADGSGSVAEARLSSIERKRVEVEVLSVRREPEPQSDGVTVAMAVVGSQAMDWAVQKAVEIGVRKFVPLEAERAQLRGKDLGGRVEHWRKISRQALKQCRRAWEMGVAEVVSLRDLTESQAGVGVVADRQGCAIDELPDETGGLLVVGPEGGFTVEERELFDHLGWPSVRLGQHVLRAETAAVVGGAMMVAREEGRL